MGGFPDVRCLCMQIPLFATNVMIFVSETLTPCLFQMDSLHSFLTLNEGLIVEKQLSKSSYESHEEYK